MSARQRRDRDRVRPALGLLLAASALASALACSGAGFDSIAKVDSVRLFAARADKPYARPGETVTLDVLAYDGRPNPVRPMRHYFVPFTCLNPAADAYYGCFAPGVAASPDGGVLGGASGAGGGSSGGFLGGIQDGTDLTPVLVQGTRYSYRVPEGAVIARKETPDEPYGLTIVFTMACAGRVVFKRPDVATRQQVPLACVDEDGVPVSAKDYVIGIHRVYVYDKKRNENPTITGLTYEGKPVDPNVGIVVDRCSLTNRMKCPETKLDTLVPEASWEVQEGSRSSSGAESREQIWVTYYSTLAEIDSARLLYDVTSGRVPDSAGKLKGSPESGLGTLFAVVHDNRGGVAWTHVPLTVK